MQIQFSSSIRTQLRVPRAAATIGLFVGGLLLLGIASSRAWGAEAQTPAPATSDTSAATERASLPAGYNLNSILTMRSEDLQRWAKMRTFIRGDETIKEVALTFDDGPRPNFTPRLLELLRQHEVKATFFVVGKMAEQYPQLVLDQLADGHRIANHTYSHPNLKKLAAQDIEQEIRACGKVLQEITGELPCFFRPPGGNNDPLITGIASGLGYATVLWTDNPGDYANPGEEEITRRLLERVRGGSVILLHDGVEQTLQALPAVIQVLKLQGYRFVTIDEMMRNSRWPPAQTKSSPVQEKDKEVVAKP